MKSEKEIKESLKSSILKMGINENFNYETKLISDGILDSFNFVELVAIVESIIEKPIDQEDLTLDNFDSVENIFRYISNQG